jgi:hypothetical protein
MVGVWVYGCMVGFWKDVYGGWAEGHIRGCTGHLGFIHAMRTLSRACLGCTARVHPCPATGQLTAAVGVRRPIQRLTCAQRACHAVACAGFDMSPVAEAIAEAGRGEAVVLPVSGQHVTTSTACVKVRDMNRSYRRMQVGCRP